MFNFSLFRRILIFAAVLITVSACRTPPVYAPSVNVSGHRGHPPAHAPAHGRRAQHSYYYYPSAEVYFDIHQKSYFYLSDGHWQVSATLPHALRLNLGSHVSLEMETAKPYRHHRQHRKSYPRSHFKKKHRKHKKHKNKGRGGKHGRGKGRGHGRGHD